ncbi:hypothetical protein D3C80_1791990 [compost metagenome]
MTYLDIAVYGFLLYSIEAETPAEVIATGLGLEIVDEKEPEPAPDPKANPLGGGTTICGDWGGKPVSLADADAQLRDDEHHIQEQHKGHRGEDIGM